MHDEPPLEMNTAVTKTKKIQEELKDALISELMMSATKYHSFLKLN